MATITESSPIEHADGIAAFERELQTEHPHLATKADVADLKAWPMWRNILVSVAVQALGIGALLQFLPKP